MARYLLFSGEEYYAEGGMKDFVKGFDNKAELMKFLIEKPGEYGGDWWHVADVVKCTIVLQEYEFNEAHRFLRCGYCGKILKIVPEDEQPITDESSLLCDDCKELIASDAALLARDSGGV